MNNLDKIINNKLKIKNIKLNSNLLLQKGRGKREKVTLQIQKGNLQIEIVMLQIQKVMRKIGKGSSLFVIFSLLF